MDIQEVWATAHVAAALTALVAGLAVLLTPKGTGAHRAVGKAYGLALVLVNAAALLLHREDVFGVFHALAVVSLATLVAGLVPLLRGHRSNRVLAFHAYCMTWSYAGLVAAGCGQVVAVLTGDSSPWDVPLVIAVVLGASGVAIAGKVPPLLRRVLAA